VIKNYLSLSHSTIYLLSASRLIIINFGTNSQPNMNNSAQNSFKDRILTLNRSRKILDSIEACYTEIEANTGNFQAYYVLGECLERLGRLKEAIPAYQTAIQIDPTNIAAWANLAIALTQAGQAEKRKRAYFQATKINEEKAEELYNRRLYITSGK